LNETNTKFICICTGHDEIPANFFSINPTTGVITPLRQIDAEELFYMTQDLTIELKVTATEVVPSGFDPADGKSISGTITVNIRDINVWGS